MKIQWAVAMAIAMAVPATGRVYGQTTGVSHPEQVPIAASPEDVQPPVVYEAPARRALSKPSAATYAAPTVLVAPPISAAPTVASVDATPIPRVANVDGMVVGDDVGAALIQTDLDAGIVTRVEGRSNELPVGTVVKARMVQSLTTQGTAEGTAFTAELTEPVLRDGRVLLPAGSVMSGRVTDVHSGRRISGAASIHLQPMAITLPDGTRYKMYGQVIDTDLYKRVKVDEEGTILGKDHGKGTAAVLGLATGSGVAAGAMMAGWPGAIIGGAVGAGVGTVVWLKQERQTEVPAGTKVVFQLTSAMMFGVE